MTARFASSSEEEAKEENFGLEKERTREVHDEEEGEGEEDALFSKILLPPFCLSSSGCSFFPSQNDFPPFQTETMRALADERAHTIKLMAEQERRNVDRLRQEVALISSSGVPPSARLTSELDSAVARLGKLQSQVSAEDFRKVSVGPR